MATHRINYEPIGQYGPTMECPITGLVIPKEQVPNLHWRHALRRAAADDIGLQRDLRAACSESVIFWLNSFGWTFLQKKIDETGIDRAVKGGVHVPFVTWKCQDHALLAIDDCITRGQDVQINKSRDMGASWLIIALFHWHFQFHEGMNFMEISRKEILVDRRGDMNSMFEKHRYLHKMQPAWLRPKKFVDNVLALRNDDLGNTLTGESTSENAGQAGRTAAIAIDEAARIRNAEQIDLSTGDTSPCRIWNSTADDPSTYFTKLFYTKACRLINLPWIEHPDKAKGLYLEDDEHGQYWAPPGKRYRSSWYDKETKGYEDENGNWVAPRSAKNVAKNIDMEHGKAGDMFFDPEEIEKHRADFEEPPYFTGSLEFVEEYSVEDKEKCLHKGVVDAIRLVRGGRFGSWRFWCKLPSNGRPDQTHQYSIGVDISGGTGSSNSVITVKDVVSNRIVAKYWDAFTDPIELVYEAMKAAIWFGGARCKPRIAWESNGPGGIFGTKIVSLGYTNLYRMQPRQVDNDRRSKKSTKYGWHSNPQRKETCLGMYRDSLRQYTTINPCKESLDECLQYIYTEKGKLEPGSLISESGGGSALHGDHVIADMLADLAGRGMPTGVSQPTKMPKGCYADRRRRALAKRDADAAWT